MHPFDAIIFDLGSTLIYFEGEWPEVIAEGDAKLFEQLARAGLKLDREEFLTAYREQMEAYYRERDTEFIEYTTVNVLRQLLEKWGYHDVPDAILQPAVNSFYAISQAHWRAEEDANRTLEWLKREGYRLGLISNAGDNQDVQTLVDKAGLRDYFDIIVTSAVEGIRKPNPKIFKKLLDFWGYTPDRVAMVGDTLGADILGAQNAGIYAIWITRRADHPANRAHADTIIPDATIDTLDELPGFLARLGRRQSGGTTSFGD